MAAIFIMSFAQKVLAHARVLDIHFPVKSMDTLPGYSAVSVTYGTKLA